MAEQYRELDDPNFDYDPVTGVRQRIKIDNDGVIHFQNTQDDTQIRKWAHESRESFSKNQRLGDIAPIGSIPVIVLYDLMKRGIWQDMDRRRKWFNSIEAAPYRLRDFKV